MTTADTLVTQLTAESREAVLRAEQNDAEQHCLVCYSPLEFVAKTPCDHNEICGVCHLRLRYLHQDLKCPICKASNASIIVDRREGADHSLFDDYPIWGESLGDGFVYRPDVGMFFEATYFAVEVDPLFGYRCGVDGCDYDGITPEVNIYAGSKGPSAAERRDGVDESDAEPNPIKPTATAAIRSLQDHLRVKHRLALCGLCVDHQRDFVSQLPRFTPSMLKAHLTNGGKVLGEQGHPLCEFCRPTRFYDFAQLYTHLSRDHYKCHVCQQAGLDNQYFKDYKSLERHFDKQHFLCHDVQCLTSRFVVFGSELDLRHHERTVHGGVSDASSKIQLEFRYRRTIESSVDAPEESEFNYDLEGQAFVPSAPRPTQPGGSSSLSLHPLHVQRTETLRQQAQALRQNQGGQDAAFPSLQSDANVDGSAPAVSASQRLRLGWGEGVVLQRVGQRQAGQVTEQDFPSLPATQSARARKSSSSNSVALSSGLRTRAPLSRQYAALSAAVSAPAPSQSASSQWGISSSSSVGVRSVSATGYAHSAADQSRSGSQTSNLTADNFPSLGPASSGGRIPYTAADALARKGGVPQAFMNAALQSSVQNSQSSSAAERSKSHKPPSLNSTVEFPPPPKASNSRATKYRVPTTQAANSNVLSAHSLLPFPSSANAKATVEDMKATLGSSKYKQLKSYTRDFASGAIDADSFVDFSASLFEHGYADFDFWSFIPSLVASTPVGEPAKQRAIRYLEQLRNSTLTNREDSATSDADATLSTPSNQPPKPSRWTTGASSLAIASPPSQHARNLADSSVHRIPQPAAPLRPGVVASKTKNAWGGGVASTVVLKAGTKPGSVAVAAAVPTPTGSATKFMAKEQKQEKHNHPQAGATGAGKNKSGKSTKSQKHELRDLAFGS
jgi:E3 ubiquitin-protein ligase ZNF598